MSELRTSMIQLQRRLLKQDQVSEIMQVPTERVLGSKENMKCKS